MQILLFGLSILVGFAAGFSGIDQANTIRLFDGRTFKGWQGDTVKTWHIKEGAMVGGSLGEKVPHNEFLSTKRSFSNYILRVKFKLLGHEGFVILF